MDNKLPFIKFDEEYFRTTVRKESRYPLAWRWVKETLQNAVDAKATDITFNFDADEKTFEVIDNGVGMDEDTILDKFLALGGSKKSKNHIGGFGDAKKVICFCWDNWSLDSNKLYLDSDMIGVSPIKKKRFNRNGTKIKAHLDEFFDVEQAISYIELCEIADVNIRAFVVKDGVRSERKLYKLMSGRELDRLEFGTLCTAKSTRRDNKLDACVVRINGLAMFYKTMPGVKKDMVFELANIIDPKDDEYILNVQREGLRWREDFVLEDLLAKYKSEPNKLKAEPRNFDNIVRIERAAGSCQSMVGLMYSNSSTLDLAVPASALDKVPASASNVAVKAASAFSDIYPYDFIIKGKTNLRYTGIKYKRFVLLWHKFIQYILFFNIEQGNSIDVGEYKIGFTFPSDPGIKAQFCELSDGTPCFLLNPDINLSDNSWRGVVLELLDRAMHEITHKFYIYHDGNFMEAYNKIKSICYYNIESFFSLGYDLLKSNSTDLVAMACIDEDYSITNE